VTMRRKSSIVRVGATASDLTVDGEQVLGYLRSTTVGPVTTFYYDWFFSYGGPCPFIGWLEQPGLTQLTIRLSMNSDSGLATIDQLCTDWDGHCFSDGQGYQDSSLTGEAWNVCP
jgi:hypothetical protein